MIWEKEDSTTHTALAGSGWTIEQEITSTEGQVTWKTINEVLDCTEAPCNASVTYKDEDPAPGKFLVKKLPVGKYRISETTVPEGYDKVGGPYEFTVTDSEETVHVNNKPIGNTRKTGNVYWGKVSSEDDTRYLAGSEWQIKYTPYDGGNAITVTITDCVAADGDTTGTCAKEGGKPDCRDQGAGWLLCRSGCGLRLHRRTGYARVPECGYLQEERGWNDWRPDSGSDYTSAGLSESGNQQ